MSHSSNKLVKILLLDDEVDFLHLSKEYLTKFSDNKLQIDFISNPKDLLTKTEILEEYDILVSDYEMPEINGLEVLTEVRRRFDNFPFILFTGKGREEIAIEALNLGVNYYINKGFDLKSQYRELLHAIETTVNQRRTEIALKYSEERFRLQFKNFPLYSFMWKRTEVNDFIMIDYNDEAYNASQGNVFNLINEKINDWMDRIPEHVKNIHRCYDDKVNFTSKLNYPFVSPSLQGKIRSLKSTYVFVPPDIVANFIEDITELEEKQTLLRESESKFRSLFEQTPIAQAERDYSEVKIYLDKLKGNGISNLEKFLRENHEELIKCAKKIKLVGLNQAALDLFKVKSRQQFSELIPLRFLDQPRAINAFINQLIKIDQNVFDQSTFVKLKIATGETKTVNIVQMVPEAYKDTFKRVWTKYIDLTDLKEAESLLHESEKKNKAIIEAIPDLLFELDQKGTHLFYKGSRENLFIDPELFIGKTVSEVLPGEVADIYMRNIERTLQTRALTRFEYSLPFETGIRHFESRMVESKKDTVLTIIRDITEQKKMREALIDSEMKYRRLIDNIPVVSWISDNSGNTSFISQNVERIYGYSAQEIIEGGDELWFGRIHKEDLESVKKQFNLLFSKKGEFDIEYRIQRKDGKWIWLHDRAISTNVKNGKSLVYGVFIDITDRKSVEIQNKAILDAIPDMVFRIDKKTKILSFRGSEKFLYLPPEEFLGKTCFQVLPENVAELFQANILLSLNNKAETIKFDYNLSLAEKIHYYEARMVVSGLNEVLTIVRDVTGRITDKEEITKNIQKVKNLFENTPIPQSIRDFSEIKMYLNGLKNKGISNLKKFLENNPQEVLKCAKMNKLINVNEATLDLFKINNNEEFIKITNEKSNRYDFVHVWTQILIDINKGILENSSIIPYTYNNGQQKNINVIRIIPDEFKDTYEWVWIKYIDLNDLKKTKESFFENKFMYETIFELVDDAILILDRDSIIECNEATIRLLGCDSKINVIGKSLVDFAPRIQPDGTPSFTKVVEKISQTYFGFDQRFLFRHKKLDNGKEFDAEIKTKKMQFEKKEVIVATVRPYDFKY